MCSCSEEKALIIDAVRQAGKQMGVAFRMKGKNDEDIYLRFVDDEKDPRFVIDEKRTPFSLFPEGWGIRFFWEGVEVKRDGSSDGFLISHNSMGETYDICVCILTETSYPLFSEREKEVGTQEFVVCPKCGSEEISSLPMERDVGIAWSRAVCEECGFEAEELFEFALWREV